jgi:LPPG:FO 2-phospho-L-lactate transferase
VVCLAGGVGGAKLADGLARVLRPEDLTVIVNTGDDFEHLGLMICPDLDTVLYTLADVANAETGWGRTGESWRVMEEVGRLQGPAWFRLGDLDLATHLVRSQLLGEGQSLTAATRHLRRCLGVAAEILPMSDRLAPTVIETADGLLPFQVWFVRERWRPAVKKVHLPEDARATAAVVKALEQAEVVIFAPSNPFVSIDPILNVYPIRALIEDVPQAVVAVSPIVGGRALKGPAAKMMGEMGLPATARAVAAYYGDLLDGFVYDHQDAGQVNSDDGLALLEIDTIMNTAADRERLAQDVLRFVLELV